MGRAYGRGYVHSVSIPASVTSIGHGAFSWAFRLFSPDKQSGGSPSEYIRGWEYGDVYYSGTRDDWQQVEIVPDNRGLNYAVIYYRGEEDSPYSGYELAIHQTPDEPPPTAEPEPTAGPAFLRGDYCNDGEVDCRDRAYLAHALAGWDSYDDPAAMDLQYADLNDNGEVNRQDRVYLARTLAGWDGYVPS